MIKQIVILSIILVSFVYSTIVETHLGKVQGYTSEYGDIFKSIRYGDAPVGSNRLKEVGFPNRWDGVKDATIDPVGCPQTCNLPLHTCPKEISEDCLFLNVFTPKGAAGSGKKLPVTVFLHGGNYHQGGAATKLYQADRMAAQMNSVVVVINYRLGSLGYMAIPEAGIKGNFGLLDQVLALKWVQNSITAFGGDPNRVLLIGQSAGAGSVASLLVSPRAQGLFHRAWLMSNPFAIPLRGPNSMPQLVTKFLKELRCDTHSDVAACIRAASMEQIVKAQGDSEHHTDSNGDSFLHMFLPWTPYVDGDILPFDLLDAFKAQKALNVPIVLGTVEAEGDLFIAEVWKKELDDLAYAAVVTIIFGWDRGQKILAKYPGTGKDNRPTLMDMATNYIFKCSNTNATRILINPDRAPIYQYNYDHVLSFPDAWGDDMPECHHATCHGAELPLFFNAPIHEHGFEFSDLEKALSPAVIQYIGNFAETGNPNVGSVPPFGHLTSKSDVNTMLKKMTDAPAVRWEPYHVAGQVLHFRDQGFKMDYFMNPICRFWDEIGYKNGNF